MIFHLAPTHTQGDFPNNSEILRKIKTGCVKSLADFMDIFNSQVFNIFLTHALDCQLWNSQNYGRITINLGLSKFQGLSFQFCDIMNLVTVFKNLAK